MERADGEDYPRYLQQSSLYIPPTLPAPLSLWVPSLPILCPHLLLHTYYPHSPYLSPAKLVCLSPLALKGELRTRR